MTSVTLVDDHGRRTAYPVGSVGQLARPAGPLRSRIAFAAAHVVPLAWANNVPGAPAGIDWDATLAFRRHLWSWGSVSPMRWTPRSGTWVWTPQRRGS